MVKIRNGVGWNKGMEGKVFQVMSEEEFSQATDMAYPTAMYPVLHSIQEDGTVGVKVLKKENVEIVEEEFPMEFIKTNKLSQDEAIGTYELAAKLAKAAGTSADEIINFVRNIHYIYKDSTTAPEQKPISERQAVVEFAKEFIEDLKCPGQENAIGYDYKVGAARCNVQFIINEEKRTVVCLLRGYMSGRVFHRGKAKAMNGDCFNVHIGKAISLAKALKKPIPKEFIDAPQPEGLEVGDVVSYHGWDVNLFQVRKIISSVSVELNSFPGRKELYGIYSSPSKVVDDSARY